MKENKQKSEKQESKQKENIVTSYLLETSSQMLSGIRETDEFVEAFGDDLLWEMDG